MFTRNYYYGMLHRMWNNTPATYTTKSFNGTKFTLSSGSSIAYYADEFRTALNKAIPASKSAGAGNNYHGIFFGNGNAAPTIDDYQLSGEHFTTFNYTIASTVNDSADTIMVTYTLTNTGEESFTIREAGVFISASYNNSYQALVWREVLDSPVTIEPGGVGQVTLTFNVNIPS